MNKRAVPLRRAGHCKRCDNGAAHHVYAGGSSTRDLQVVRCGDQCDRAIRTPGNMDHEQIRWRAKLTSRA